MTVLTNNNVNKHACVNVVFVKTLGLFSLLQNLLSYSG